MHVISRKALRLFWEKYPDSETALARWFKIVERSNYQCFDELQETYTSADNFGKWIVFNVGGNKYRLITVIHFQVGKVYVRHVLTYKEYEKGNWKL